MRYTGEYRVYIDYAKLEEEVNRIGVGKTRIARGIGYSDSLFANARERGYMVETAAERLERIYGIRRKVYEVEMGQRKREETVVLEPKAEEKASCGLDYVQLYNTIYTAALAALQANAKGLHEQGKLFEVK